jgi:sulfite reductase alpha subunit-like flavoprotein
MKWRLAFLSTVFVGLLVLILLPTSRNWIKDSLSYSACNTPLPYKIGSIDPRFGIGLEDVEKDTTKATNIWSGVEGKQLFTLSRKATLSVNFVYDQRQELNSEVQQLDSALSQKNASLQQKIQDYEVQEAAFQKKLATFNALVDKYNSEGGAPQDVYKSLIQQQKDLDNEGKSLNAIAHQLNLSTHDYNADVSNLNSDIGKLNTVLSSKPEEGLYNGYDKTITIYITNSNAELIHTLAHEFGHALGMTHVDGESSIMYAYTSDSLDVTNNDLKELAYVCRQQSLIIHEAIIFNQWVSSEFLSLHQYFLKK